jgi:large conductance mechanosensitive channel
MLKDFRDFISRGNVVDLAVGVIIGGAFGKIVSSLVSDVMMPPLGLLVGRIDFSNLFINLGDKPVKTVAEAKAANVPTLNYGTFLDALIQFIIMALVVFLLVRGVNKISRRTPPAAATKSCPFCAESIPVAAKKCGHCTTELASPPPLLPS